MSSPSAPGGPGEHGAGSLEWELPFRERQGLGKPV
jgi:hypothetical protein